jgi:hypothetical protein
MHPIHTQMYPLQYHGKYHGGAVVAVTASAYDEALSSLRDHVEDLAVGLGRRCASDAVDAIDAMLG